MDVTDSRVPEEKKEPERKERGKKCFYDDRII